MRPVLVLLACEMAGGDSKTAIKPALGIELFHNFTLLHDDIMDQAPLRRGQPTVYKRDGINTAILSGDVMMVKAYQLIGAVPSAILPSVLEAFNRLAIEVCEGQQLDLEYEQESEVTIEAYLEMISLKTAALLAGSMEIGALLAGRSLSVAKQYHQIGWDLGLAFQLQDDLLDTYGEPSKFGKQVGGDIIQNKKTFLLLKTLELANTKQRTELDHWQSIQDDPGKKVDSIKAIYDQLNIRQLTEQERDLHFNRAMEGLEGMRAMEQPKNVMVNLCRKLLNRDR